MTESNPSKSARKREQLALQALGEKLIALSETDLAAFGLDERLYEAVRAAAGMTSHGALRRQRQLIGKLMRDVDPEPIRAALARLTAEDVAAKRRFAAAERWRDRIAADGRAALDAFETETGASDATLRQLLTQLGVTHDERREKTLRREIFRRLHAILGNIP